MDFKVSLQKLLRLALIVTAVTVADHAGAARPAAFDHCRIYGFAPHSRDYTACRMNSRRFWTTGRCGNWGFAATHREYCHLNPPPFI